MIRSISGAQAACLSFVLFFVCLPSSQASNGFSGCVNFECDGEFPLTVKAYSMSLLGVRSDRVIDAFAGRSAARGSVAPKASLGSIGEIPDLPLQGEIAGEWDAVDGYLTFARTVPTDAGAVDLDIVLRGLGTERVGLTNRYDTQWDRQLYWLDFNANDPLVIPRLLPALELVEDYQYEPGDPYPLLTTDPAVTDACSGASFCTINFVSYLELNEEGRDYSAYPDGAALAQMLFVADENGNALAAVLIIYDENGDEERTDNLFENDALTLYTIAFRASEPEFYYVIGYMEPVILGDGLIIEARQHVPGVDFVDPDLPDDLDAANRPIQFVLEGEREVDNVTTYRYGGPFDLGYNWDTVQAFVFGDGAESLRETRTRPPALLKKRQSGQ